MNNSASHVPKLQSLAAAVQRTGCVILRSREHGGTQAQLEGTQYKAVADLEADACLRSELQAVAAFPVVSEEDLASQSDERPPKYWLIDPIDGTASFVHGFPGFVCQAALIDDRQPILACVHAPALDLLYLAERGRGASVNGRALRVHPDASGRLILVDNYPEPRGIAQKLFADLRCTGYVESGSIGLKVCLVAEARADLFVKDVLVKDWDVAPAHLILTEAGGVLTQLRGEPFEYAGKYAKRGVIAASSNSLLAEASAVIARYDDSTRRADECPSR